MEEPGQIFYVSVLIPVFSIGSVRVGSGDVKIEEGPGFLEKITQQIGDYHRNGVITIGECGLSILGGGSLNIQVVASWYLVPWAGGSFSPSNFPS